VANALQDIDDGEAVRVSPITRLRGELHLPGDKSISHRAAILAALAHGESKIENFSSAADCSATLECLRALGVDIARESSIVRIKGAGSSGLREPSHTLSAENSGTTMRLLAGVLAGLPFTTTITGDESLLRRPMRRVAEPLRLMGAKVELQSNGCAPMRVTGLRPLRAIEYKTPIASAQIKSAVLLAGLAADGTTRIEEPQPTRDHTERLLGEFGVPVEINGNAVSIEGGSSLQGRSLSIPGDFSSAAFFVAAAVSLPGSDLVIRDVGLNPTRTGFLTTLQAIGAVIEILDQGTQSGEPVGSIRVRGFTSPKRERIEIFGRGVADAIDELPLVAFLAASIGCEMELRDAEELRVKESDRIAATVTNLTRMGALIDERDDGWLLRRGGRLQGARLSSFNDHRIAMCCAVAALSAAGPSTIEGANECVRVSLPEFWQMLGSVSE
jgi:3-phosphoshikimate 1-carboxyvinyltransferase